MIEVVSNLFILQGIPAYIRSDSGAEFLAKTAQDGYGAKTAYIERDEMLDGEIFYTQIVIESWRRHYNTIRPHASLAYKPPAPEVFVSAFAAWPATLAQGPALN